MWRDDAGRKMGAVAPILFGAIECLLTSRPRFLNDLRLPEIAVRVKRVQKSGGPSATHSTCRPLVPHLAFCKVSRKSARSHLNKWSEGIDPDCQFRILNAPWLIRP